MPARRDTTAEPATPIEETTPTAPAQPGPDLPEPTAPEPETDEERIGRMVDEAVARLRPANPFSFLGHIGARSAAAEEGEYPLTVHEAITEVTQRVDAIAKAHTTEGGERYKYRGIDDVFAALHPLLADAGLVIMPGRMVEHRRETRQTSKGGTLNVALVRVRYTLVGPDGSKLSGEAWGEAHDSGDKATQKALSQAYKSFALQLFSIPTESSAEDDPDRTNEPGRPFTQEEQDRAAVAYDAALDAKTLEQLVGVRRRAEHLLDVPVRMTDGTLHPLRLLFESRRLALEGAEG